MQIKKKIGKTFPLFAKIGFKYLQGLFMKFVLILSASSVWLRNQIPPSVMCVFV